MQAEQHSASNNARPHSTQERDTYMKRRLSILVAASLAAVSFNSFSQSPSAKTVGVALDEAWNSRDITRVEKLYAERARITDVREGDIAANRADILRQVNAQWQSLPAQARQRTVVTEQRDLGNGQTVVEATIYVETANAAGAVETLSESSVSAIIGQQGDSVEVIALRNARALAETSAQSGARKFRITRGLGRPFASQG
jgi:hypothetical protein